MGIMGICLDCNQMAEYGTSIACKSKNVRQASYQDLVSRGVDEWYALELTGDVDAGRELMKDMTAVIVPPSKPDSTRSPLES
jgi:hypothetical protein